MERYHDTEWGVPIRDGRTLFEFLTLDAMQAGLSWRTILYKRENLRRAFSDFDARLVARYDAARIERLLADPGIIRNRLKIEATVSNARALLRIEKDHGDFGAFIWALAGSSRRRRAFRRLAEIPACTDQSRAMSKALVEAGFRFVGPTICYAFMQATGMVNDHLLSCFRYRQVEVLRNTDGRRTGR
jgi:DNA-3-methyladenine glycosylase I